MLCRAVLRCAFSPASDHHPCLTYGMRGLICLVVEARGPSKDLHSGTHGGTFSEPLNDLVTVLSNLVDANGMILIPGEGGGGMGLIPGQGGGGMILIPGEGGGRLILIPSEGFGGMKLIPGERSG